MNDQVVNDTSDNPNVANSFTFPETLNHGTEYEVTVNENPPGYTCVVINGEGIATANSNNIAVVCDASNGFKYISFFFSQMN
jgi:hypothetical protein